VLPSNCCVFLVGICRVLHQLIVVSSLPCVTFPPPPIASITNIAQACASAKAVLFTRQSYRQHRRRRRQKAHVFLERLVYK
jgi:hypothetical protein